MHHHVLLLNADAQPLSFLPISTISWQDAVRLKYLSTASVLHLYDDWIVHSPSITMTVPSVMILHEQVRNIRRWIARDTGGPQRSLVFLRDMFICQYCNKPFGRKQLTIDHVVPRKYGGRTQWDNVVTCCAPCNCERGSDTRIQPLNKPFRPGYGLLLRNMRQFPLLVPDLTWNYYLGWSEDKLRLIARGKCIDENFDFGVRLPIEYA